VFGLVAITLTFVAFYPYISSILKGTTKPHVFSWVIWALTTSIVFFAQLDADGGVGAWPIGLSGLITAYIAYLAYTRHSDISVSKVDWLFFVMALLSLPCWFITSDPLWAVVILTGVDILGFGPTLRKAYANPHQENILFYLLFAVRNVFAIFALEHYSVATVLFPFAISLACLALIAIVVYRRRDLGRRGIWE
jgi:hypothetical protein